MSEKVVITGAASGIGKALAKLYLEKGDEVAALDYNASELAKLEKEFSHRSLSAFNVNVSLESDLQEVGEKLKNEFGKPSIWINNAGIAHLGAFEKIPSAEFDKVVAVNFNGVVYGTRVALSLMKEPTSGAIVNVASVNAEVAAPYMTCYVAAKHAVAGFTKALQLEMKYSHNPLQVTLVTPGFAKTPIMKGHEGIQFPQWLDWMVDNPESVAKEIIRGVAKGKLHISPTLNGKVFLGLHRIAPSLTEKLPRLLVAKNWKEALGLDPIEK